jgi:hypothetical protein
LLAAIAVKLVRKVEATECEVEVVGLIEVFVVEVDVE